MSEEKTTKTDVKSVLTKAKFDNLVKGSETWKTFDKDAKSNRSKFYVIGCGLDVIYTDLKDKGIKRDEIAHLIEQYFPGMTIQNRSDFRKMALNQKEIETYCLKHYKRGFSPSNIIYNWTRFKAKIEKNEPDVDNTDKTTGKRTKVTEQGLEVQPHKLKTGLSVEGSKVTVEDVQDISMYYFNNIENLYNDDKFFSTDDTMAILQYIHDRATKLIDLIDDSIKLELKKAA